MDKHKSAWWVINGITMYRVVAAPFLLWLVISGRYELFRWLLGLSFFTDAIDGYLARKYKVTSVLGTRLDSIGDDLTVLVAVIGLFIMKPGFIRQQQWVFIALLVLFLVQTAYAFSRYGKMSNFHTYLAKTAAVLQGIFLLLVFFTDAPILILFYAATGITMLQILEEIVLVYLLPSWKTNVKGIYWVLKDKRTR